MPATRFMVLFWTNVNPTPGKDEVLFGMFMVCCNVHYILKV